MASVVALGDLCWRSWALGAYVGGLSGPLLAVLGLPHGLHKRSWCVLMASVDGLGPLAGTLWAV